MHTGLQVEKFIENNSQVHSLCDSQPWLVRSKLMHTIYHVVMLDAARSNNRMCTVAIILHDDCKVSRGLRCVRPVPVTCGECYLRFFVFWQALLM